MSNRRGVRPLPTNRDEALQVLYETCAELTERVADLESRTGALPGDYRFAVSPSGEVQIRRVSTGTVAAITPPL